MRSPRRSPFGWLLAKEWRELWASRAWWLMLGVTGPLVGASFISAVRIYAEASGYKGTSAGVGEAFSPLVGVWAPTFSAYELVAAFLFPFVVIRLVGADRQSGVAKLELQQPLPPLARMGAKALALAGAWLTAMTPALMAGALWLSYGGSVYAPEVVTVACGHLLNAALTIAIGAAAASATDHPATAAIAALFVTIGGWMVSFFAALHGGWWERAAAFTAPALVAQYQHGLIRLDVLVAALAVIALGLGIGAVWMQLGAPVARRAAATSALAAGAAAIIAAGTFLRPSWDASENRQNSFSEAEEAALASITAPLTIEAYFAPSDARRSELERGPLAKLTRVLPRVSVHFVSQTSVGFLEANTEHYGEIVYTLGGRSATRRAVTSESVVETVLELAGVTPPAESDEDTFRGHPLAVPPRHAATLFYGVWPAIVAGAATFHYRRTT